MSTGGAQSRAVYEAELIDKITKPVDAVVQELVKLHKVLDQIGKPVGQINSEFKSLNKEVDKISKTAEKSTNSFMLISNGLQAFQRGIFVVGQGIGSFLKQIGAGLRTIGLLATALSTVLAGALIVTTMRAAEAQDALAAFDQVFGDQADAVGKWAKEYSDALGRSERATKEGLTRFRSFFLGIGRSEEEATQFSKALVAMAADLSAFNGSVTEADAMARLQSALSGTAEALDIFGIALRVGSLDQFMARMGMAGQFKDLEESEKVLVRLSAILDGMGSSKMLGQAEREVSNFRNLVNNAFAILSDTVDELGLKVIQVLTPSFVSLGAALNKIKNIVKDLDVDKVRQLLGLVAIAGAIGTTLVTLGTALTVVGQLALIATGVTTAFTALFTVVTTIGTLFGPIAAGLVLVTGFMAPLFAAVSGLVAVLAIKNFPFIEALQNLADTAGDIFDTLTVGTEALLGAIISEDWDSAWKVATLAGELAFRQLYNQLLSILGQMTFAIEKAFFDVFTKIGNTINPIKFIEQFAFPELFGENEIGFSADNVLKIEELRKQLEALKTEIQDRTGFDTQSLYDQLRNALNERLSAGRRGEGPEGAMLQTTSAFVAARNANFMPVTEDQSLKEARKQTQIQGNIQAALEDIRDRGALLFT